MRVVVGAVLGVVVSVVAVMPALAQQGDGRQTGGGSKELPRTDTIDVTPFYTKGVDYLKTKDYARAIASFRQVLEVREQDPATNMMMGVAQIGLNDLQEARRYLARATTEKPNFPEAIGRLGWVEAKLGNAAGAATQRAALQKIKDECKGTCPEANVITAAFATLDGAPVTIVNTAARFNAGVDAINARKYAEAESAFKEVVAAKPDDWEASYFLGQAQQGLGNLAGAKASYEHTLNLKAGVIDARARLGWVEKKLGNAAASTAIREQIAASQTRCAASNCAAAKAYADALAIVDAP